jgi:hypothetical protein
LEGSIQEGAAEVAMMIGLARIGKGHRFLLAVMGL